MNKTLAEDQAEVIMKLAVLPEERRKAVLGYASGLVLAYESTKQKKEGCPHE